MTKSLPARVDWRAPAKKNAAAATMTCAFLTLASRRLSVYHVLQPDASVSNRHASTQDVQLEQHIVRREFPVRRVANGLQVLFRQTSLSGDRFAVTIVVHSRLDKTYDRRSLICLSGPDCKSARAYILHLTSYIR